MYLASSPDAWDLLWAIPDGSVVNSQSSAPRTAIVRRVAPTSSLDLSQHVNFRKCGPRASKHIARKLHVFTYGTAPEATGFGSAAAAKPVEPYDVSHTATSPQGVLPNAYDNISNDGGEAAALKHSMALANLAAPTSSSMSCLPSSSVQSSPERAAVYSRQQRGNAIVMAHGSAGEPTLHTSTQEAPAALSMAGTTQIADCGRCDTSLQVCDPHPYSSCCRHVFATNTTNNAAAVADDADAASVGIHANDVAITGDVQAAAAAEPDAAAAEAMEAAAESAGGGRTAGVAGWQPGVDDVEGRNEHKLQQLSRRPLPQPLPLPSTQPLPPLPPFRRDPKTTTARLLLTVRPAVVTSGIAANSPAATRGAAAVADRARKRRVSIIDGAGTSAGGGARWVRVRGHHIRASGPVLYDNIDDSSSDEVERKFAIEITDPWVSKRPVEGAAKQPHSRYRTSANLLDEVQRALAAAAANAVALAADTEKASAFGSKTRSCWRLPPLRGRFDFRTTRRRGPSTTLTTGCRAWGTAEGGGTAGQAGRGPPDRPSSTSTEALGGLQQHGCSTTASANQDYCAAAAVAPSSVATAGAAPVQQPQPDNGSSPINSPTLTLLHALDAWRTHRARLVRKTPEALLRLGLLADVAARCPISVLELEGLPGLPRPFIRRYGQEVLDICRNHMYLLRAAARAAATAATGPATVTAKAVGQTRGSVVSSPSSPPGGVLVPPPPEQASAHNWDENRHLCERPPDGEDQFRKTWVEEGGPEGDDSGATTPQQQVRVCLDGTEDVGRRAIRKCTGRDGFSGGGGGGRGLNSGAAEKGTTAKAVLAGVTNGKPTIMGQHNVASGQQSMRAWSMRRKLLDILGVKDDNVESGGGGEGGKKRKQSKGAGPEEDGRGLLLHPPTSSPRHRRGPMVSFSGAGGGGGKGVGSSPGIGSDVARAGPNGENRPWCCSLGPVPSKFCSVECSTMMTHHDDTDYTSAGDPAAAVAAAATAGGNGFGAAAVLLTESDEALKGTYGGNEGGNGDHAEDGDCNENGAIKDNTRRHPATTTTITTDRTTHAAPPSTIISAGSTSHTDHAVGFGGRTDGAAGPQAAAAQATAAGPAPALVPQAGAGMAGWKRSASQKALSSNGLHKVSAGKVRKRSQSDLPQTAVTAAAAAVVAGGLDDGTILRGVTVARPAGWWPLPEGCRVRGDRRLAFADTPALSGARVKCLLGYLAEAGTAAAPFLGAATAAAEGAGTSGSGGATIDAMQLDGVGAAPAAPSSSPAPPRGSRAAAAAADAVATAVAVLPAAAVAMAAAAQGLGRTAGQEQLRQLRAMVEMAMPAWEVRRVLACRVLSPAAQAAAVLRLEPGASRDSVRLAFRRLSLLVHPDKNRSSGAAEAFALVSAATSRLLGSRH